MDDHNFELHLEGERVSEEGVPYTELSKIIGHLKDAALGCLPQEQGTSQDKATFNIVAVKTGSLAVCVRPTGRVLFGMMALKSIKEKGTIANWPARARYALRRLHRYTDKHGLQADIILNENITLEFGRDREYDVQPTAKIKGDTEVVGKCEGIGGSERKPKAKFVLATGQLISLQVSKEQASKLAQCLYRTFKIKGEATWSADNLEMLKLKPVAFEVFTPSPIAQSLKQLYEISDGAFDHVNVEDFTNKIRGRK